MFKFANMFRALFNKKAKAAQSVPPRPPWNEIVEFMRDKGLELEEGEMLIRTLFGENGEMRFVIFKTNRGFFRYRLERLCGRDDDEWAAFSRDKGFLPGMWIPQTDPASLFETEQLAMNELVNSPEYREYFEK